MWHDAFAYHRWIHNVNNEVRGQFLDQPYTAGASGEPLDTAGLGLDASLDKYRDEQARSWFDDGEKSMAEKDPFSGRRLSFTPEQLSAVPRRRCAQCNRTRHLCCMDCLAPVVEVREPPNGSGSGGSGSGGSGGGCGGGGGGSTAVGGSSSSAVVGSGSGDAVEGGSGDASSPGSRARAARRGGKGARLGDGNGSGGDGDAAEGKGGKDETEGVEDGEDTGECGGRGGVGCGGDAADEGECEMHEPASSGDSAAPSAFRLPLMQTEIRTSIVRHHKLKPSASTGLWTCIVAPSTSEAHVWPSVPAYNPEETCVLSPSDKVSRTGGARARGGKCVCVCV